MASRGLRLDELDLGQIKAAVIGLGGAGLNLLDTLADQLPPGCVPVAVDTDWQRLRRSACANRLFLETGLRRGGTGHDPLQARRSAELAAPFILESVAGMDLVVVLGGLGGGTASGAAPVFADLLATSLVPVTIGLFTMPLAMENPIIQDQAAHAAAELQAKLDLFITFPNSQLIALDETFDQGNAVLAGTVRGFLDLICLPCDINLDLADLTRCLASGRDGLLLSHGPQPGLHPAVKSVIDHPLWQRFQQRNIRSLMMCILGGQGVTMSETGEAMDLLSKQLPPDCLIYWGFDGRPHNGGLRLVCLATAGEANPRALQRHLSFINHPRLLHPANAVPA